MNRVLKFTLRPGITEIATDAEPRFLAVGWQDQDLVVWCEATVGGNHATRLSTVATGQNVPDGGEYLGTAQTDVFRSDIGGPLVMHIYRVPAP